MCPDPTVCSAFDFDLIGPMMDTLDILLFRLILSTKPWTMHSLQVIIAFLLGAHDPHCTSSTGRPLCLPR